MRKIDVLIGTRMHSNIFALSVGTPVIAVGYLPKTDGIMEMMGLSQFVVHINDVTPRWLQQKVDLILEKREEMSMMTKKISTVMQLKAEGNSLYVKSLLEREPKRIRDQKSAN